MTVMNENQAVDTARPNHQQKQRIVIAGDGIAAWMAAAALSKAVPATDYSIIVAGSRENTKDEAPSAVEPFGLSDSTLPWQYSFPASLELDNDDIVSATGGSFSYGIAMSGWAKHGESYLHPFGSIGASLGPVSFQHLAMRLRKEGLPIRFANYSMAALAAQAGKFARPGSDPHSVLSTCRHGLHIDLEALVKIFRALAESAGVSYFPGPIHRIETNEPGNIHAIEVAGGRRIEGDLFVDCTGIESCLMGQLPDSGWEDWSAWLPCDHLVSTTIDSSQSPPPFSHAMAHDAGWIRELPLPGKTVLEGLHNANIIDEREAVKRLLQSCDGQKPTNVHSGPVRFGRRKQAWLNNCISLGTSAALIDPVAISNLQLLRSGINRLLTLLPAGPDATAVRTEFNRQTAMQLDNARDFAILHYKLNGRTGEPFWDICRSMQMPESLAYKLRLYESNGLIAMYDEEPLEDGSWLNLYDEHGIRPDRYSPIADGFRPEDLLKHLQRVRDVMMETLKTMPTHAEYLLRLKSRSQK